MKKHIYEEIWKRSVEINVWLQKKERKYKKRERKSKGN